MAKAKKQQTEKKTEIAIFADDVLVDGGDLNADWVYIDPDLLNLSNTAISGDYTLEARVIILNNFSVKSGEKLTSFTLKAANEQTEGTYAGNVSITLSNSNIVADSMNISATATTNAAEAAITISNSTLKAELNGSALSICATSESGNARVDIQNSRLNGEEGVNGVEVSAVATKGNAAVTLDAASSVSANLVSLTAAAVTGDANLNMLGKITGGSDVTITASTGSVAIDYSEDKEISEMKFTPEGGGNASVTVDGTVDAKGSLTVSARAQGTHGDATLTITDKGKLTSMRTETKQVGDLQLARTQEQTVMPEDSEETVNAKNTAYLNSVAEHLKKMETATAPTATIDIAAIAAAGNATVIQAAQSELKSNLYAVITADAAKKADLRLAGKVTSGDIYVTATGETATLSVAQGASLAASPHQSFVREDTVISLEQGNGIVALQAGTPKEDDQPDPEQVPQKNSGVLLEVAGSLTARRETKDGEGEGGTIFLASEGKLTVTDTATLDASSANGLGGTITFDAPEYELKSPLGYKVTGTTGLGTIDLTNYAVLSGNDINYADDISREFIKRTLNITDANAEVPKEWQGRYGIVKLSGDIKLVNDVTVCIRNAAIADNTTIDGQSKYSLTLKNIPVFHMLSPTSVITIGNDVHINQVKDFSFVFRKHSALNALVSTYLFSPVSLTVGKNFTVDATGDVTMSMEGIGNTYITFASGVNINAKGNVTIKATNQNGWGTGFFSSNIVNVLGKAVQLLPGAGGTEAGKFISQLGVIKFDADKFFKTYFGKSKSKELQVPQLGLRISKASVTFANNAAGTIQGKTVTIGSASTANVSGRKKWENSWGGLSVGVVYNSSMVDLGKNLTITATGYKETTVGDNKVKTSVSITSSTNSKVSQESLYDSNAEHFALGVLISLGFDYNTVNIDKSVTISAPQDINITTKSSVAAEPFMTLSSGAEAQINLGSDEKQEAGSPANNVILFGLNLLDHKSQTTINGTLNSHLGSINMKSEDSISSSLTMNGGIQGVRKKKKPDKALDPSGEKAKSILDALEECITIDFGAGKLKISDLKDPDFYVDLGLVTKKGKELYEQLMNQKLGTTSSPYLDLSIATDIVKTKNILTFNGEATAGDSVTLDASTEVEAACGAETSIVGLPSERAVAGSVSIPVVSGTTTVEIGSNAVITAGKDIAVSSSTELPMAFDFMGWREWQKFIRDKESRTPSQFVKALRGSLKFAQDYHDNGDLGILDSVTSSHASTILSNTGSGSGEDVTGGGSFVVDIRNLDTKTIINDNAKLTAGGKLSATSSAEGRQITFAGQLPVFLTLGRPAYFNTRTAASGYGGSFIIGEKTLNTVTYIGAATLTAGQLNVDATGDVFLMEMNFGATVGSSNTSLQIGCNVIVENKMTISEISGGANITLTGTGESSITATDKSALINLSGALEDSNVISLGFGLAVTVNNSLTGAMLGNGLAIKEAYGDTWKALMGGTDKPFNSDKPITLSLKDTGDLRVEAYDTATIVDIGIAGARKRKKASAEGDEEPEEGEDNAVTVAANLGVLVNQTEATARQYKVVGPDSSSVPGFVVGAGTNKITTKAGTKNSIVSVAGDVSGSVAGKGGALSIDGAVSYNRNVTDTTAYVTECKYVSIGAFTVDASNTSTIVAVDMAVSASGSEVPFGMVAGAASNQLYGNTHALLTGGSISGQSVSVTSDTNLTSFSCTLGAAIGISLKANGEGHREIDQAPQNNINEANDKNDADVLEKDTLSNLDNIEQNGGNEAMIGESLALGEDSPILTLGEGASFDLGASIARNKMGMHSKAIVEGCAVSTTGALTVTAEDTSVITAVSVEAAVSHGGELSIGAGGVFSFAPVSSTTEAAIKQKSGVTDKLVIQADSLTLHAEDKHRTRVWSFGGGYGDTIGVGMVLSWGSFAGASTTALIKNVDAFIGKNVDIKAYSDLSSTFISVGGSGSKGYASGTGMINYLNFNNQVITDIKDSILTVSDIKGSFTALSESKRTFTDGVGNLNVRVGADKVGAGVGAALSFVYLGGNGATDTNLTEMLVSGSEINTNGKTELLAKSTTSGTLAGANPAASGSAGTGVSLSGSFSWLSDASVTQVNIKDTFFNRRAIASGDITAKADSVSDLTFGFGTLGIQIGKGAGIGASIGVLKDKATTTATMSGGGVENTHDFTLQATGKTDMTALIIGGSGALHAGVSGGALGASIAHNVAAYMEESVLNMNGALTIKAENTSNVGRDHGPRFTIANAAVGKGGVGVGVSVIDVADIVSAHAHNVSVNSGSMAVTADETSNADSVTVNLAGGLYAGAELNVVRPVLRGIAEASITADRATTKGGTTVGIVGITTTSGGLSVKANNNQWMRSHLWAFALAFNPKLSIAADICVNSANMIGSANAMVKGAMPLTLNGDLSITADTTREATYTTVAVSGSLGISLNVDVNTLRVSNDTSSEANPEAESKATKEIDKEIEIVIKHIQESGVKLDKDTSLTLSSDVKDSMTEAVKAFSQVQNPPKTSAVLDLGGKTAKVGGKATITASDNISTTPTTVNVTGGILAIAPHVNKTTLSSIVEATVDNTVLNAVGDIEIDAKPTHKDYFRNVGVAVSGVSGTAAVYKWNDTANTKTSLGKGTSLSSTAGSIKVNTHSDLRETFHHVNVGVSFGNIVFIFPSFTQNETNTLNIADNVSISAAKNVAIGTNSVCNINTSTYDIVLGIVNSTIGVNAIDLVTTQSLNAGKVNITGASVDINQTANRTIGLIEDHISISVMDPASPFTNLNLSFPFMKTKDTVNATLKIGDGSIITATSGALSITSHVESNATLSFLGVNGAVGVGSLQVAANTFTEKIDNETKLGKQVKLNAAKGAIIVQARNKQSGSMAGTNIAASLGGAIDILTTANTANTSSKVTIGSEFEAQGKSLTLEATNEGEYLYSGKKVTVALLLNPIGRNAYNAGGTTTSTITLDGGKIDVEEFNARAMTDVDVQITQLLAGGALVIDVNTGKVTTDITQNANITLGTENNELDILTDGVNITAHNKSSLEPKDKTKGSMVYGADFAAGFGTSIGTIDAKDTVTATVTMGSGSKIRRRGDADHYLNRNSYKTLISATNNVESNAEIALKATGALNANCRVYTYDQTKATATLDLNGSIDTWGDTELTAYSHTRHNMINSVISGAMIPTFKSGVINTIDATDTVNINQAVESIGDITIQAGSAKGMYTLVDGTTVQAGADDTNTTNYYWGKNDAIIYNKRRENLTISQDVRAGGELAIYNDSSANTVRKSFSTVGADGKPTGKRTAEDFTAAARDTAAEVTSSITIGKDAELYAGLNSAASVRFLVKDNTVNMQFITPQKLFDGSPELANGWEAPEATAKALFRTVKVDGKDRVIVNPLSLSGMAFRIETKANQNVFAGKLYSPAEHGLDILFPSELLGDVETQGVTLRGHETGLIFNRKAVNQAVRVYEAAPDLLLKEGVAIRSVAGGDLFLTGVYELPYSTFLVKSEHNLTITGFIYSGSTTLEAGGNFTYDQPAAAYAVAGSALAMYSKLLKDWSATLPAEVETLANEIAKKSGDDGKNVLSAQFASYKETNFENDIAPSVIKKAAESAKIKDPVIAGGTVSIKANIVDLNGAIYSGFQSSQITLNPNFNVQTSDNQVITVAAADKLYEASGGVNRIFRLDGYQGISLVYDAKEKEICLNSYTTLPTGIYIEGTIVNSNPDATKTGLYVASNSRPVDIVNNTGYRLNIGNVDLRETKSSGITLKNTATGKTTTYTQDAEGKWTRKEGSTSSILSSNYDLYTGLANYQVKLSMTTELDIEEQGRLEFAGPPLGKDVVKGYVVKTDGYIGNRRTIIDRFIINSKGARQSDITATYVLREGKADGYEESVRKLTDKVLLADPYNPGTFRRWQYRLGYTEKSTDSLYIGASNSVAIHLGSTSKDTGLSITGGEVNFTGHVQAPYCKVNGVDVVTATQGALIDSDAINMRVDQGSIGTAQQALAFNAASASFSAGQDIYLSHASNGAISQLALDAGNNIQLRSAGSIGNLAFHAKNAAVIEANGQITVSGSGSSAASTYLSSATGGILVKDAAFAPGILSAEAEGDISISTSAGTPITVNYMESRTGQVSITAPAGILSSAGSNLNYLYAAPGGDSTSSASQALAGREDLSDEYYAKLVYYESLYYEKDQDGNYTHRAEDGTFILPEEEAALQEMAREFQELYDSGQGDYLGLVLYALSGTDAVGGTTFSSVLDALAYLANNSDKLQDVFAPAYYNKLVADLTDEIVKLHGSEGDDIDFGEFNEIAYRLYWMKDDKGNYVNQDEDGNFINPERYDAFGNKLGYMYDEEMCKAIKDMFGDDDPERTYSAKDSKLLGDVASAASGLQTALLNLSLLEGGPAAVASGQPLGDLPPAIRAKEGVSLKTNADKDIGGGVFNFSFKPIAIKEDGSFVYSDWVNTFRQEIRSGRRQGVNLVSEDPVTGELRYAMSHFTVIPDQINLLELQLLQQAVPMDIHEENGVYIVQARNFVSIDAPVFSADGKTVLVKANGDIDFGANAINARNLYFSTTGSITGSVESQGGIVSLYANGGIGSADKAFNISGTSTYTLGADSDVFLQTDGAIKLSAINGNYVTIDARNGSLTPTSQDDLNIIGRRIDYYGDLDTGLGFRTFGTSEAEGGLHWHGGSSKDLKYNAFNTAYKFWFKAENAPADLNSVEIGYSGHLVLDGLPEEIRSASFSQENGKMGLNVLEINGEHTFSEGLAFGGEAPYTILAPELLTIGGGSPLAIGGDAAFRMAGIQTADGSAIRLRGTGNLAFSGYTADSACEFRNALVIDSPGDIEFAGPVTFADSLTITGAGDRTIRSARMMTFISGADINVDGNVSLQLAGIESVDGSPVRLRSTGNMAVSGYTADSGCTITAALALDSPGSVTLNNVSSAGTLTMNAGYGIFGRNVTSPQIIANSANADVFLNADTYDLSGSSWNSFVVDLEPIQDGHSVIVHDISVNPFTGRVVVRSLSDQLLLDGAISGAALEFYSPGDIMKGEGVSLLSEYPFIDVWREFDPTVYQLDMEALRGDLTESFIWCVDDSYDNAPQNSEDARKLRRKAAGETDILTLPELRFLDQDGNTVSREQYANLITNK